MSKRAIIPLVIGLGVGLFALKLGLDVIKKAKGTQAAPDTAMVVVAAALIGRESAITEEQIKIVPWPASLVPSGSFSDPSVVVGRVAKTSVVDGMFLTEAILHPPGAIAGLSATIPEGYRAVAVKVDEFVAVGNWVEPGARVDVLVVMNSHSRSKGSSSRVILHNIEVLAVGQVLEKRDRSTNKQGGVSARSVTLLVREQDAPKLHLASSRGKIRFALRGQKTNGSSDHTYASANEADLFGGLDEPPEVLPTPKPIAKQAPPRRQTWTVELKSGQSKVQHFSFASPYSSRRVPGDAPPAPRNKVSNVPASPAGGTGDWDSSAKTGASSQGPSDENPSSLWGKVFDVNGS